MVKIDEGTIVAKLVKAYLTGHPKSTSKQIHDWLAINDFGLHKEYSHRGVTKLISHYCFLRDNVDGFNWFNVVVDKSRRPYKYSVGGD